MYSFCLDHRYKRNIFSGHGDYYQATYILIMFVFLMLNIVFGLQDANSSPADASRIGKAAAVVGTWKKGVAVGSAICIRHPAAKTPTRRASRPGTARCATRPSPTAAPGTTIKRKKMLT